MASEGTTPTLEQFFSKPRLSFSIERILSSKTEVLALPGHSQSATKAAVKPNGVQTSNYPTKNLGVDSTSIDLPWLSYTRYSPPRVPRSRKSVKRKTSGSPRVPFSTAQLITLEGKFVEARYLSGPEVSELSASLNLSEERVKIWFQNRRAREKKTKQRKDQTSPKTELDFSRLEAHTQSAEGFQRQKLTYAFFANGPKSFRSSPYCNFFNHV